MMFIFMYPDGTYAGMDHASGGYPYQTINIGSVHIWYDPTKAFEYGKKFPELVPHTLWMKIDPCDLEKVICASTQPTTFVDETKV